jgi:hypothetical protein
VAECGLSPFLVCGNEDQPKKLLPTNVFDK